MLYAGPLQYRHPRTLGNVERLSGIVIGNLLVDVPDRLRERNRHRAETDLEARAQGRRCMVIMTRDDIDDAPVDLAAVIDGAGGPSGPPVGRPSQSKPPASLASTHLGARHHGRLVQTGHPTALGAGSPSALSSTSSVSTESLRFKRCASSNRRCRPFFTGELPFRHDCVAVSVAAARRPHDTAIRLQRAGPEPAS